MVYRRMTSAISMGRKSHLSAQYELQSSELNTRFIRLKKDESDAIVSYIDNNGW